MKIYMAAAENKTYLKKLQAIGADNLLMSFFYLRGLKEDKLIELLTFAKSFAKSIFLDSGAHSLIVAYGEDKKKGNFSNNFKGKINIEEYVNNYLNFITKYHKYFDSIAELDIQILPGIGYEKVKEWREYMIKIGLRNKMVVVLHYKHLLEQNGERENEWRDMLKKYPKLALGDGPEGYALKRIFDIWQEEGYKNKVHGFAETKIKKLKRVPYYSVDSTTWQTAVRFNQFPTFLNGKLKIVSAKQIREKLGIDLAKMPVEKKILYAYNAYKKMEKYITALQKAKGIERNE